MKFILSILKKYRKECIIAPLFKMLEAIFELFVPIVVASVIDNGIAYNNKTYIIKMVVLLVVLAIVGLSCSITAQYFAAKAAVNTATSLRSKLFKHIQSLSFTELDTLGISTLITRMTSDINQVQNGINMVLRLFLRSPFIVFGSMIMAFTIDFKAALIFLFTIPVLSIVVFGIMKITRPLYKKSQTSLDRILGITKENLSGARVIRAFNNEDIERRDFYKANENLSSIQKLAGKISGLMNPLTYIIINVAIIILVWTGAIRVDNGILTQGQVIALYNYMSQILVELIKLANLIVNVTKAVACANRLSDVFEINSSMKEGNINEFSSDSEYEVEFKNVSFKYQGSSEDALTNINFSVKKGETIGVIGGTGSGKSSLVNLIPRYYDVTDGEILIDGRNVKEYTFSAMQKKVSIVFQKAQLFKGTIKSNLLIANGEASEAEIKNAIDISQSTEFIENKDKKINSEVEQEGKNLSGGQKQRLTIARALVKNSDILILDDSASALDYATDAKLRKALANMKNSPTVFIVSQRTASIMHADKIIVLDDGKVVGIGNHRELLDRCEVYREIYDSQFKKEGDN
ncbi:ABC transporter ATP-binding protein/permease [Clostridium sp. MSJ-8]|uniref:ABC transporter ATP-binding protein n=1 Tax=Clostridium sp. MSJ-8 TaxID=2841510 RepID=UPI001C0F2D7F|nr:ABC transporter ATP-binding protein [Clostridium sp. MSJ-8]MBU5487838.1 ABC transporter ATP-binding protein/permease [Clostridium sp. MSJ-8]